MAAPTRVADGTLTAPDLSAMRRDRNVVRVLPEVAAALAAGAPVVALESSVLAQGLPIPSNRVAA